MKFLDNKRNEHDTRIGALLGTVLNKTDSFIEKHFPGYNVPFMGSDIIDADFRDVDEDDLFDDDDNFESTFYDPEEENKVTETPAPVFALRFKYNQVGNIIEVINSVNGNDEIIDRITVTESISEGCISNELQRYTCNIRSKETLESLAKCLDDIQIVFNNNIHAES